MDNEGNLSQFERQMMTVLQQQMITTLAKLAVVEARSRALEGVLSDVLSTLDTPPFPAEELPDRIRMATSQQADSIVGEMADVSPSIASHVHQLIDQSNFGPLRG